MKILIDYSRKVEEKYYCLNNLRNINESVNYFREEKDRIEAKRRTVTIS